jgi:hypothetical protein
MYFDRVITLRRVAALTGVPVRRQQRWARLVQLLVTAALSAAVAGLVVRGLLADEPRLVRLLAGALLLGACYAAATWRRYLATRRA